MYNYVKELTNSQRAEAFRMAAAKLQKQEVHVQDKPCDDHGNGCTGHVLGDAIATVAQLQPWFSGGYCAGIAAIEGMASGPGYGRTATYNDTHTKDECVAMLLRCAEECQECQGVK